MKKLKIIASFSTFHTEPSPVPMPMGYDPCGTCFHRWDFWNDCDECEKRNREIQAALSKDLQNFDLNNTDPEKVFEATYFSAYKGALVVILPINKNAFSYGVIFLGENVNDVTTLEHEYGHVIQYADLGARDYLVNVAIPSLIGFWSEVPTDIYYSQPWEYGAEKSNNVERDDYTYGENAEVLFWLYWIYVKTSSAITMPKKFCN